VSKFSKAKYTSSMCQKIATTLARATMRDEMEKRIGTAMLQQVRMYEQAHNSHDVEKIITLFTDDVQFETVDEWIITGKEKIRDLAEWEGALQNHLAFTDLSVSGDTVTCKAVEDDDLLRLAGFREIRYDSVSVEFQGDLIKKITLRTAEKDREATSKTFHSMVDWATRERHSEIVKLVSGGKFAYNARNADG
jgi:hypothetical protein